MKIRHSSKVSTLIICIFTFLLVNCVCFSDGDDGSLKEDIKKLTHILRPGAKELGVDDNFDFQIFCRLAEPKYIFYYFRTATLRIISSADDIKLMKGHSPKDVYFKYKQTSRWYFWIANILPWRVRDTNFPTFNTSCVGISTSRPYSAMVIIRPIDPWRILILAAGISLFFFAPNLSKSAMFFYSSGTLLGAVSAALVLLFIVSRFLPKGKSSFGILSILWTLAFYYAGETWKRFEELVHERLPYIVVYLTLGAVGALIVCYRYGPPSNPKTLNLMQWALQIIGIVLIFFSSDLTELSVTIMLGVVLWYNCRDFLKYHFEKFWRKRFPPKAKLLTEEEYHAQAAIETRKGLDELKSFCSSPDANPWKLVNRLKDPRRFSSFISGTSHLSDDEILAYESDDADMSFRRIATPQRNRSSLAEIGSGDATGRGRGIGRRSLGHHHQINNGIIPLSASSTPTSPAIAGGSGRGRTLYPALNEILTDDEDVENILETDDSSSEED